MGKNLWLTVICVLGVFLLIVAFENIFAVQTLGILFIQQDLSSFMVILMSAAAGFLMGFSFMMYSHEVRQEKEMMEQEDALASAPAKASAHLEPSLTPEPKQSKKKEAQEADDAFDTDEEVLG